MLDAAKNGVDAIKAYIYAEEVNTDLADQMATAIERLLEAIALENWDVAMVFDAYMTWREGN